MFFTRTRRFWGIDRMLCLKLKVHTRILLPEGGDGDDEPDEDAKNEFSGDAEKFADSRSYAVANGILHLSSPG